MSRSTPRTSPTSRARRRVGCILPAPPPMPSPPTRSPDSLHSTLLPYYHSRPASATPSIRPSPPVPPSPELRRPPVDPRKSRRYCTDFGLAHRAAPRPPPLPMYRYDNASSAGSTPQSTYAETDSDASSWYQHLELEFPQPPASPALRRMQSSPLFTPQETDAVRDFLRKRWGTQAMAMAPKPPAEQSPLSDYSWDAECDVDAPANDIALELAGEQLIQAPAAGTRRDNNWLQMSSESAYSVAPLRPARQVPVLRRAASMAAPATPQLLDAPPPPLPTSVSAPPRGTLRFQDLPPPSLARAGRQKPHHRPNLSVPLMGLGLPAGTDAATNAPLGPSFTHHRAARSQPNNVPRVAPRSFIDLTPEKIVQRESTARVHRDRVKRLLSRASSGFIGWGKALAGKKH
ncbi:hypothetical protein C8F04DRAFT_1388057 [Mycena alexandri]|uniref:Uncharacterized protein n=1 Tax=Mycena alexandri TaxID=1745969 RepID=A0AAD6TFX1_9AGAR|nr:hypothetical protein C8F04DRAFT_1388057 [Mycena alexandri]